MSLPDKSHLDDLDIYGSNWDILQEIDKFLEGYSSDGEELPVNHKTNELNECELQVHSKKNDLCVGKTVNAINSSNLVVENSTEPDVVEFIGKKPAVFELLEDHDEYAIYEHNPNEANWNVFYKTLPPGKQQHNIKKEPGTQNVDGNFNTYGPTSESNSQNELNTFSFCLDNLKKNSQPFNIKLEPLDTENDPLNKIDSPSHFSFNLQENSLSKEKSNETLLNGFPIAGNDKCTNSILENFSFLSSFDNQESNHFEQPNLIQTEICLQNQNTVILEENSFKDILPSSSTTQEDILKSKIELEKFSFSIDNINEFQNPSYVQSENFKLLNKNKYKNNIKNKRWSPFKQSNHSYSRSTQKNLPGNFQNYWKQNDQSFIPHHYKKPFNKFQGNRSRSYKPRYNKEYYKDSKLPLNTGWQRRNNCSPKNRIVPYINNVRHKPSYIEKKLPQPITNFQLPHIPMSSNTFKPNHEQNSWIFPEDSTQHNSDNFKTKNVDENNLQNASSDISNGDHTYKHSHDATEPPFSKNQSTPEFTSNFPSFNQILNCTSLHHSEIIEQSYSEFQNFCDNSNNNLGKITENNKTGFQTNEVLVSPKDHTTRQFDLKKMKHIISDYLSPESLVGSTVKFTSRKLANTMTRDKLMEALESYGEIENSWWTPDDYFFVTYSSRNIAKRVCEKYPKNPSSSY